MIRLFPYESLAIDSPLSVADALQRLQDAVCPERSFSQKLFGPVPLESYTGEITRQKFCIRRIISYRNSFLPEIVGEIVPVADGSIIYVKMRLKPAIIAFMTLWLGGVGLFCLAVLWVILFRREFSPPMLIPFGMFLFGYALVLGGFTFESRRSKSDLDEIFCVTGEDLSGS